ncbi:MAG: hypothetical protein NUV63_14625, partial [Gallionella sp.]|nr:hypothetical protein [Gallionella sp.]
LYDAFHEFPDIVAIADQVSGRAHLGASSVDPAVYAVNRFIARLHPFRSIYHFLRKIKLLS